MDDAVSGRHSAETRPRGIHLGGKIWLVDGAMPVFGTGICELLSRVETTGSLRRAASDMGMAYSKAWRIVRRAEDHLGFTLLERRAGGKGGGGSIVSNEGRWLVGSFGALVGEAEALLDGLYAKHFGSRLLAGSEIRLAGTRTKPGSSDRQ
ncbi:MAG: LysR family transcriptional regulator [Candidatus Limnocylindrales bacterium]|jgi:molybdate transport system regulatory protein